MEKRISKSIWWKINPLDTIIYFCVVNMENIDFFKKYINKFKLSKKIQRYHNFLDTYYQIVSDGGFDPEKMSSKRVSGSICEDLISNVMSNVKIVFKNDELFEPVVYNKSMIMYLRNGYWTDLSGVFRYSDSTIFPTEFEWFSPVFVPISEIDEIIITKLKIAPLENINYAIRFANEFNIKVRKEFLRPTEDVLMGIIFYVLFTFWRSDIIKYDISNLRIPESRKYLLNAIPPFYFDIGYIVDEKNKMEPILVEYKIKESNVNENIINYFYRHVENVIRELFYIPKPIMKKRSKEIISDILSMYR